MTYRRHIEFLSEVFGGGGGDSEVTAIIPDYVPKHCDLNDVVSHANKMGLTARMEVARAGRFDTDMYQALVTGPKSKIEELLDSCAILPQHVKWKNV